MAGLVEADRGGRGRIRRCLRASVWSRKEAFPGGAGSVGHWQCDSAGVSASWPLVQEERACGWC
ncbi:hypothetical protein POPTR_T008049v4 [Populus trichocarpa]|uniref:Uncharacterized protein n=1 Tax=Populus trichocarpa TaxID=3694 RepID=A0ACC0RIJ1_POPTR|nr:hypothetical protein BDE02_19G001100 [Populus trichocarpa]KAI9215665.1 hypothetical protein POPTR_T008049v4 [Populus trichocarpa]